MESPLARKRKKSRKSRRAKSGSDRTDDELALETAPDGEAVAAASDEDAAPAGADEDDDVAVIDDDGDGGTVIDLDDDEDQHEEVTFTRLHASAEDDAAVTVVDLDDDEVIVIDLDDEGTVASLDEEVPPEAVIDVEEDLDDPEVRAALIAAAAGLGAEDEPASDEADDADGADEDTVDEGTDDADGADEDTSDAPLIGADALVALSQFRAEGIATVPEEIVLELGEATSPEERDRLLAAALAHVEMQEAIYRVPSDSAAARRWKGLIAAAIFVAALTLAGLPPRVLVPAAAPGLSVQQQETGLRTALLVQAEQIEAFRAREGQLPTSLTEVPRALAGIRFVKSSNRLYQLTAVGPDGKAVVYDSAAPDPAFARLGIDWLSLGPDS